MLFTIYFLIFEAFPLSNDHDLSTSKDYKRNLSVITSKNSSENNNFRHFTKTTEHEKNIKADPEKSPTMSPEPTPILDYSNKAYIGGGLGIWLLFNETGTASNGYKVKYGKFTLQDCLFENNYAGYKNSETAGKVGGSGGGFQCGNSSNAWTDITIINCTFRYNRGELYGGALDISSSEYVIIENNTFINNSSKLGGGAIHIVPHAYKHYDYMEEDLLYTLPQMKECTISNCTFIGNKDSRGYGHVIYFQHYDNSETEFHIKNKCTFINNGGNEAIDSFTIIVNNEKSTISDSIIEFSDVSKSSGGVEIKRAGDNKIQFTKFIRTVVDGILYKLPKAGNDKKISITDCIFDACTSSAIYRVLLLSLNHQFELRNNTFQNTQYGNLGISIITKDLDEINIESCTFINNSMSYTDNREDCSGGCGIFITRENRNVDQYRLPFNICYSNCEWINNSVDKPSGGGGIQVGKGSLSNIGLTFDKCTFEENKALKGGALSIETILPLTIKECTFRNNEAYNSNGYGYGGAIYINPYQRMTYLNPEGYILSCEIMGCTFEGNSAQNQNGHILFMEGNCATLLYFAQNNTLINNNNENGGGNAIYYKGQNITLEFPQFLDSMKSRFIEFGEGSDVDLSNVEFKDCFEKDGDGNVIKISENSVSVSLTDCSFTNCGESGYIIKDLGAEITFTNCTFFFDDTSKSCCALDITTKSGCTIEKCQFIKNNNNEYKYKSAILYYHPTNPTGAVIIQYCLFDQCNSNSDHYKTFSIQSYNELIFSDNTIQNIGSESNPTGYIGEIVILSEEEFKIERCNYNHIVSSSKYGGGTGIKMIKSDSIQSFKLTYDSCEWYDNHAVYSIDNKNNRYNGVGGALQQGIEPSLSNVELKFDNCTFKRNRSDREGGALAIQTKMTISIVNSYFEENKAGVNIQDTTTKAILLEIPENIGCGGAIYVDPDFSSDINDPQRIPSCNIIGSTFIRNEAVNCHAIYIRHGLKTILNIQSRTVFTDNGKSGCTILTGCEDFIADYDTVFNFTNSVESSRPYDFEPGTRAIWKNLRFEDLCGTKNESEGNVIHVSEGVTFVTIINCSFINCGKLGWVITCYSAPIYFMDSTITFDDPENSIKGLGIWDQGKISIQNSLFQRCNCHDLKTSSAGLLIQPPDPTEQNSPSLEFYNNTFDEIYGLNQRCFAITWWHATFSSRGISIIRSPLSGYTAAIYLISTGASSDSIINHKFDNWSFISNTANSMFGGGCGILVAGFNKQSKLQLNFIDCTWYGNKAVHSIGIGQDPDNRPYAYNGLGGAFQQGFSETNVETELTFTNCLFENNIADAEGGALAIQTITDTKIQYCTFNGNQAGVASPAIDYSTKSGGAIFIDPDFINPILDRDQMPNILIDECTFKSNTAMNGHAISITRDDALLTITNNNFIDNGDNKNSIIYSVCESFVMKNNSFKRSADGPKNRAIELEFKLKISLDNITFDGCISLDNNGGAILFRSQTEQQESLTSEQIYSITNCKFINCQAENGGGLYIKYEDLLQDNNDDSIKSLVIENCFFDNCVSTNDGGGFFLRIQMQSFNDISIISCIFNSCKCNNNNQCFDIAVSNIIAFKNNTIKNMISSGNSNFGQIKNSSDITSHLQEIVIDEITFINNVCNSLFGGGSGLMIHSEKIVFNECKFIKNTAVQMRNSNDEQRPQPDGIDSIYYNGDGGGIQIGYSSSTSNTELEFTRCNFTDNKATRHGGAVEIQTLKMVFIFDCIFESNTADNRETSSSLLSYENHFDKKKEGRGGAIYINPTFSFHEGEEIYPSNNDHMKAIDIKNCTFIMNQAFDGFVIYIEGDEPENNFEISIHDNLFINNKQINEEYDINQTCRALIASEVSFNFSKTIIENIFNPSTNISLVDHYGNLIHFEEIASNYEITPTKYFTNSNEFTSTNFFTISNEFTNSETLPSNNNIVNLPATKPQASRKITYSRSYSLTYVNQKSVSFSLSFVSSNVYEMSYDFIKGTYSMFASQTNYQSYFPYIIYYMSPLYVEKTIIIDITPRRKISPEQLIGVVCGSASVFFLILGIIILAVRKHNEIKNQYDEFDDISYSSEEEIKENNKNANETNTNDCQETNGINGNNLNEF